jgi:outer membrane protein assembly factor BamB
MRGTLLRRPILGWIAVVAVAASVVLSGCGGSSKKSTSTTTTSTSTSTTTSAATTSATTTSTPTASAAAAGWTLPGGNLDNTRDVTSPINASNVADLKVAWKVPIKATGTFGGYATTPVVVNGVVYTQDLDSNVEAIKLSTGKVLWTHTYNSPNVGPDGVTMVGGTVYAATATSAVALQAATGEQLWSKKIIRNDHEGIDMAPGYNNGTVYVSTVPGNNTAFYAGNGEATLWALNAKTGKPEWKFNEVGDLWSHGNKKLQDINSGGGQWDPPSFDSQGNVYIGVANPAPFGGAPHYPNGTSRPGKNLYTDSVVKLSPQGKLLWYYQLTPHDISDWDINNSPVLTTAGGQPIVIAAGKAGIVIGLNESTGKLMWKTPVGVHNGLTNRGLETENLKPTSKQTIPAAQMVEPGELGGVESQLATNGSTTFAAVNDLALPIFDQGSAAAGKAAGEKLFELIPKGTGEMVAVNNATGKIEWDTKLPSSPYGAAAVTNNVVFTTTFSGEMYAFNASTGAVLMKAKLPAGTNAPVAIDGDYVITAGGYATSKSQKPEIVAYKLGGSPAAASTSSTSTAAAAAVSTGVSVKVGMKVFATSGCASCHTLAAAGSTGTVGPNLDQLKPSYAAVLAQVTNGGGVMPSFKHTLSKTQIESVAKYVSTVAGTVKGKKKSSGSSAP